MSIAAAGVRAGPGALLSFAEKTAREAGEILLKRARWRRTIEKKGRFDLVTDADRASESAVVRAIERAFPTHGILGEEGASRPAASDFFWVIDPLDGTTNYAHGFPFYCVSIACLMGGRPLAGAIYDPVRDELFAARAGGPATMNGRAIHVSDAPVLEDALLATGFPYNRKAGRANNFDHHEAFTMASTGVRRVGAAALDICYVACGRLDGFWEIGLKPWDVAAGVLIATRAGGRVTDFGGERFDPAGKTIIVSNGRIHRAMVAVISRNVRRRGAR